MIDIETIATIIISVAIGLLISYLRSIDEKISEIKATVHPEVMKTRDKLDEIKITLAELKSMLIFLIKSRHHVYVPFIFL